MYVHMCSSVKFEMLYCLLIAVFVCNENYVFSWGLSLQNLFFRLHEIEQKYSQLIYIFLNK